MPKPAREERSAQKHRAPRIQKTIPTSLPDAATAAQDLARFQVRALVSVGVRIVLLGVLVTLLKRQNATWEAATPLLYAGATLLAVWPLFTSQGKMWAGRIRLGGQYVAAGRFQDAADLLAPLARPSVRGFDAAREGTFYLAQAWQELGQTKEATLLWEQITREVPPTSPWREQALSVLRTIKKDMP